MYFEVPAWDVGAPAVEDIKKKSKRPKSKEATAPSKPGISINPTVKTRKRKGSDPNAEKTKHIQKVRVELPPPEGKSKEESKLVGARFRFLNQKLYESSSEQALAYFTHNPTDFAHYHVGFREQTKSWPVNPVDIFIRRLKKRKERLTIADLGCGEAKIASTLKDLDFTIHSFDLAAVNEFVTVGSMTDMPLDSNTVDIAIFCLSLMNTDYTIALTEAHRILKPKGELWIAEVTSRFDGEKGINEFMDSLQTAGFGIFEKVLASCSSCSYKP